MALQNTDFFLVNRAGTGHRLAWSELQSTTEGSLQIQDVFSYTGATGATTAAQTDVPVIVDQGIRLPVAGTGDYNVDGAIRYSPGNSKIELYYAGAWNTASGGTAFSSTPPSPATEGDVWYDTDNGRAYVYYNDGTSSQWVEMNPAWDGGTPPDSIGTSEIQDGSVTPAKLSTGGPQWDTAGNVGIGTAAGSDKLTIRGTNSASDVSAVNLIQGNAAGSEQQTLQFIQNGVSKTSKLAASSSLGTGASLIVTVDGSDKLTVPSSGNITTPVGITATGGFTGNLTGTASEATNLGGVAASNYARTDTAETFGSDVTFTGVLNARERIDLADHDKLTFGTGDDCEFYSDGSHMYMNLMSGIGNFYIRDGSTTRFTFDDAGHFTATGNIIADGQFQGYLDGTAANATQANTASYATSAGNASTLEGQNKAYYTNASSLSSGTISDSRLPNTISSDITGNAATADFATNASYATSAGSANSANTATNASNATNATNADSADYADNAGALGGHTPGAYLRANADQTVTAGNTTFNGTVNIRTALDLADSDILRFGTGDDVELFFNGSNFYTDLNSGNWYVRDGNTTRFTFDDAGHFTATGNITANGNLNGTLGNSQVRNAIALGTVGQLGTYALCKYQPGVSQSTVNNGGIVSGSDLRFAAASGSSNNTPNGSWQCMGRAVYDGGSDASKFTTLWLRIT